MRAGRLSDAPSDSPKQHENHKDDEDEANYADSPMTEAVAVTAEAATEAAKQEDDEDDDENEPERHDLSPVACTLQNIEPSSAGLNASHPRSPPCDRRTASSLRGLSLGPRQQGWQPADIRSNAPGLFSRQPVHDRPP
jgi:hypothetical protein